MSERTVSVIGGGIVGLATAYQLHRAGMQVTLVDRDPKGDKVSLGNAGGIAVTEVVPAGSPAVLGRALGWMFDPLGPLAVRPIHAPRLIPWLIRFARSSTPREIERISLALAALNSRVYQDLVPLLDGTGLSSELRRHGALSVYETPEGFARDAAEWHCKRSRGIVCEEMSGAEARRLEPALGPLVCASVCSPQWSHLADPARLVVGIREWLFDHGVVIRQGEVSHIDASPNFCLLRLDGDARIPC